MVCVPDSSPAVSKGLDDDASGFPWPPPSNSLCCIFFSLVRSLALALAINLDSLEGGGCTEAFLGRRGAALFALAGAGEWLVLVDMTSPSEVEDSLLAPFPPPSTGGSAGGEELPVSSKMEVLQLVRSQSTVLLALSKPSMSWRSKNLRATSRESRILRSLGPCAVYILLWRSFLSLRLPPPTTFAADVVRHLSRPRKAFVAGDGTVCLWVGGMWGGEVAGGGGDGGEICGGGARRVMSFKSSWSKIWGESGNRGEEASSLSGGKGRLTPWWLSKDLSKRCRGSAGKGNICGGRRAQGMAAGHLLPFSSKKGASFLVEERGGRSSLSWHGSLCLTL